MSRLRDSGQVDLSEVFLRVQQEMLAQMAVGGLFENSSAAGAATERNWINLFNRYLPQRYRSTSAFVIDSTGRRSRQIDIAIFDNLYSPLLFPHPSGLHIAAESVYAVFEVKPTISRQYVRDAGEKAASVRALLRTSVPVLAGGSCRSAIRPSPIIAGLLGTGSAWGAETFGENVRGSLDALSTTASNDQHLDLGCSLRDGAFEQERPQVKRSAKEARCFPTAHAVHAIKPVLTHGAPVLTNGSRPSALRGATKGSGSSQKAGMRCVSVSSPDSSLIFFILRLLQRLREMGVAPAADLMEYGRSFQSFKH
jgi:hypothetical protein